ncbi:hypothetical protein SH668x_000531 [Planctomicrobium sp. SH668]|uniref:hypothetical protein n=1 Tax=Planctomicrobium sp. SH668 TaxID=3448126 RepID=UPI003F5C991F
MIVAQTVLGNLDDPQWRQRIALGTVDHLELNPVQGVRSGLQKTTDSGLAITLSFDRRIQLRDGDVIDWDAVQKRGIVLKMTLPDVLIVELAELQTRSISEGLEVCFQLGVAIGNQHWPSLVKDKKVFVPLSVDRSLIGDMLRDFASAGMTYRIASGIDLLGELLPYEARRLFAQQSTSPH